MDKWLSPTQWIHSDPSLSSGEKIYINIIRFDIFDILALLSTYRPEKFFFLGGILIRLF